VSFSSSSINGIIVEMAKLFFKNGSFFFFLKLNRTFENVLEKGVSPIEMKGITMQADNNI
jgi:hypothetical protein